MYLYQKVVYGYGNCVFIDSLSSLYICLTYVTRYQITLYRRILNISISFISNNCFSFYLYAIITNLFCALLLKIYVLRSGELCACLFDYLALHGTIAIFPISVFTYRLHFSLHILSFSISLMIRIN